jgi:competence protein ComEA
MQLVRIMVVVVVLVALSPLAWGETRFAVGVLNVNTASAADLAQLPGVGDVTAYRIVKAREGKGEFRDTRELLSVKGVSKRLYSSMQPHLAVKGESSLKVYLDLNEATRSLLMALPGGSATEARSILALRTAQGRFRSVEELRHVAGMDEKRYAELRELVGVTAR